MTGGGGGGGGGAYYYSYGYGMTPLISITLERVLMALTRMGSTVFKMASLRSMSRTYG